MAYKRKRGYRKYKGKRGHRTWSKKKAKVTMEHVILVRAKKRR